MEENIAILIADLSGYTALTETHGPSTAADQIEKFTDIVTSCLVKDNRIYQWTGDEVLIVSDSADHLMASALLLLQFTHGQENFLQVHGGLHYGKILKRNNNYFGTTINLTSRIAGKASPGSFWCSIDFVNALSDKSEIHLQPKGRHGFKNLSEESELFELIIDGPATIHIDPVCRMRITDTEKAVCHPETNILFCSPDCLEIYLKKQP